MVWYFVFRIIQGKYGGSKRNFMSALISAQIPELVVHCIFIIMLITLLGKVEGIASLSPGRGASSSQGYPSKFVAGTMHLSYER